MRAAILIIICSACTAHVAAPDDPPDSVRERFERGATRLVMSPDESAGVITAERRASDGWRTGIVDLHIEGGVVAATADAAGVITLEQLEIELAPIVVPETVIGREAQLTQVRVRSTEPVLVDTRWATDDDGHGSVQLDLALSWSLSIDGSTAPLGAPDLRPVPVELVFGGDGSHVRAELRVHAPGELWSWAGLVKLEDLELALAAKTP
jgi:hypothetical protein